MRCPLNSASFDPVEPKAASLLFGGLVDSLYAHTRFKQK